MQPVDLANRLIRQADLLVSEDTSGPFIPNHFSVAVNDADMVDGLDIEQLTRELGHTLESTAQDRGWRIGGPIFVRLRTDPTVGRGSIRCEATSVPALLPAWGELAEHRGNLHFPLRDNRITIGRSETSDVTIDDPEVSRLHAVLSRRGGRFWLTDLGSANGTSVNGVRAGAEPIEVGSGDMLSFGPTTFALRVE